jgi:hypothetical protein
VRGHRGNLSLVKPMTTEFTIGLSDVTEPALRLVVV